MGKTWVFTNTMNTTMDLNLVFLILVGVSVAAAAGFLGSFMVLKRMSLVGDALSHVALPGMAIALVLHVSPILGAFVALFFAILGIWYLGEKSSVYPEAIVGVIFTGSLALGMLITPEPELLEALFGNIEKVTYGEGIWAVVLSLLVIVVTIAISKKLMLTIVSSDLAKSYGIKTNLVNLTYLLLIGVVVALGIKFVGTLLTGALVIIPAAAAKNVSNQLKSFVFLATLIGIVSAATGVMISSSYSLPSGPVVVLSSALIFGITYFVRGLFAVELEHK